MGMQLYPHQIKALNDTKKFNRVGYFLDMGLGKTFVGSEKMILLKNDTNLIVCQKSKIDDWITHFQQNYTNVKVWDLTKKKEYADFSSRYTAWHGYLGASIGIGIINYELAFRRSELLKLEHFTLMLDESSMITNPVAKRTKFIHKLNPDNVILLSGTPTGGKYEKLWSQLRLLGWSISKDMFYSHYVDIKWLDTGAGFLVPRVVGYKNVDRLKAKLKRYGCIFMKTEEVFDLPEKIPINITVPNTKYFKRFMKDSIITLPDGTQLIGDNTLTKHLFARQLCGQYNQAKLSAFKDLVQSTDDRLIVFYNFTAELIEMEAIAHELDRPFSLVTGACKRLDEYENYSDSLTFVQYQAGAMGLNLQKANKMVFFTLPQSSELYEQSIKRIHRIGQEHSCFYYYLLVADSVEQDMLETLKMRKDYDDALFKKYEDRFRK